LNVGLDPVDRVAMMVQCRLEKRAVGALWQARQQAPQRVADVTHQGTSTFARRPRCAGSSSI
jgi:hypothetical protein